MASGHCDSHLFILVYMEFLTGLNEWGYIGLFIAAFVAGSILPFSSEVVLALLLVAKYSPGWCLAIATLGNWLGGMSCYYFGRLGKLEWLEKYLKISQRKIEKTRHLLDKKGAYMSFFSFIPGIGGAIVVTLGYMRSNPYITGLSMFAGKILRYYLIVIGIDWIF